MTTLLRSAACFTVILMVIGFSSAQAQTTDEIGGPYEPDENTILLLHFDGDLSNSAASFEVAEPIGSGQLAEVDDADFIADNRLREALGRQVFMNNQSAVDSTYISIPDTADLDLTGDWTMEYWVNVFSFGTSADDHNFHPRLLIKRGPVEDQPDLIEANFWNNMNGNLQNFITGYATAGENVNIGSPSGLFQPNNWYHVAYIRDTTKRVTAQLIHQVNNETGELELLHFQSTSFAENPEPPLINTGSVFIGGFPDISSSWLNGALDEIRISNVVRNFVAPPIATATDLENQAPGSGPFEIEADIQTLGDEQVESVMLHYDDGSGFQSIEMTEGDAGVYTAQIPDLPEGTSVAYYVEATTAGGLSATDPGSALDSERPDIFYQFAVVEPESQVLHLTFEEGEGVPVDRSDMGHDIQVFGNPTYSTDAAEGDYSLQFAEGDSAYLMIDPSPALSSEEFTIDFWFSIDTVKAGTRYIVKQGSSLDPGAVFHINYKIFNLESTSSFRAASRQLGGGLNGGLLDPGVPQETGEWFKARYYMSADTAYFQVRTAEGGVFAEAGYSNDNLPAQPTNGPFFIGFSTEPGADYFIGRMDDIQIHNYPKPSEETSISDVTKLAGTLAPDEGPYQVDVEIDGDQALTESKLVYSTDGETWQEVDLSSQGGVLSAAIPEQEAGTIVRYYVVVEDASGARLVQPATAEADEPDYFHFGVGDTEALMLHLTFEEGSGVPQNHGLYDLPITVEGGDGTPTYSEDAAEGDHSFQFSKEDSVFLKIDPAPFASSPEFLLDFWFKPDGPMEPNDRLVVKQGGEGITDRDFFINYKIFALGGNAALRGASWQAGGGLNGGNLDTGTPAAPDAWYRAVYYMSADTAFFAYYDVDGNVVGEAGYSAPALPSTATYGPLYIGWAAEPNSKFFNGKIDDLKFYNFAKLPEGIDTATDDEPLVPLVYELGQNYPNPVRSTTTIKYALPDAGDVRVELFDLLGRRVATLVDAGRSAGRHETTVDLSGLGSGIYFYRLIADDVVKTKKLTLIR